MNFFIFYSNRFGNLQPPDNDTTGNFKCNKKISLHKDYDFPLTIWRT